ncbi:CAU/MBL1b family subclass B3 metallo-beta-lactamase [soil metagenome]
MMAWRLGMGMSLALLLGNAPTDDPLLRPIQPQYAARFLKPQPPLHVHGNSYLVGFAGVTVGLIRTRAGLILIDGALPQGVREVEANIRKLGFSPGDVKLILSTEPHYDHAGGLAALARDTGATVVAGALAAPVLRSGIGRADDPQAPMTPFPGVAKVRALSDGGRIRLGEVTITAIATHGHTPGSMSWTWQSCENKVCVPVVFAASLNPASSDDYHFSAPANRAVVASFRQSFARMHRQPCGILITAHPEQSGGDVKYARLAERREPNPYLDRKACRGYADKFATVLEGRLREGK